MIESVVSFQGEIPLSELIARVSKGERITITNQGVPIAVIAPAFAPAVADPEILAAVAEMKAFRKGRSLKGLNVREMVEEGRRF